MQTAFGAGSLPRAHNHSMAFMHGSLAGLWLCNGSAMAATSLPHLHRAGVDRRHGRKQHRDQRQNGTHPLHTQGLTITFYSEEKQMQNDYFLIKFFNERELQHH